MHIGIDARLTYYQRGGISTYIRHLVHKLERLDAANRYTILHSRKAHADQRIGKRFRRVNLWTPSHHRLERTALSVEISRLGLDIVHTTDFIPPRWGAKRFVTSIHDLTFLHYPQYLTAASRRHYNDQIHAAVQRADHILTISHASRTDIINMLNVPPNKVTVHLLGTTAIFKPQSPDQIASVRSELDLPERYILYLGTFEPRKNIIGLLEAYQILLRDLPDAPSLVLAGNRGWLFDETMDRIEKMQLRDRIYRRENIPQAMLPALYSGAVVHTMPSFYEGFGLPALEAMACGTVSIVSNRSSLPEVVGDVGIQIDPDDPAQLAHAFYKAITDNTWRTQQEAAARQQAAKFTWDETAQVTLSAYQHVMEIS